MAVGVVAIRNDDDPDGALHAYKLRWSWIVADTNASVADRNGSAPSRKSEGFPSQFALLDNLAPFEFTIE